MGGTGQQESGVISVRSPLSSGVAVKNLLAFERRGRVVFARIGRAKAAGNPAPTAVFRTARLFVCIP